MLAGKLIECVLRRNMEGMDSNFNLKMALTCIYLLDMYILDQCHE